MNLIGFALALVAMIGGGYGIYLVRRSNNPLVFRGTFMWILSFLLPIMAATGLKEDVSTILFLWIAGLVIGFVAAWVRAREPPPR